MGPTYAITRQVEAPFDDVVERLQTALADEGFGILTTIDVQATLGEKLGEQIDPYIILGACNPELASRGLAEEPDLGVLLPCNVVVRADHGGVRVAAMEPTSALALADNPALAPLASEARDRLERAVAALQ